MKKKKLIALGLTAIMALSYSGSVFAAPRDYYLTGLVCNKDKTLVTGSVSYTPTSSESKYLGDTVSIICDYFGAQETKSRTTYGVNATSTTISQKLGQFRGTPISGYNTGLIKVGNAYQEFNRIETNPIEYKN